MSNTFTREQKEELEYYNNYLEHQSKMFDKELENMKIELEKQEKIELEKKQKRELEKQEIDTREERLKKKLGVIKLPSLSEVINNQREKIKQLNERIKKLESENKMLKEEIDQNIS